jgi:crotonobetainyl-CoA:carnitine CoA-transferase CaiB-like acyl-CoA transferase
VPVGEVVLPHQQPELAQLAARGFFEEVDHPVAGRSRYATMPMTFSRGPERVHARHAPLLGEHTAEVLAGLGLTPAELEALEADRIIGCVLGREP